MLSHFFPQGGWCEAACKMSISHKLPHQAGLQVEPAWVGLKKKKKIDQGFIPDYWGTAALWRPASLLCVLGQGCRRSLQTLRNPGQIVWLSRCRSDANPTLLAPPSWPGAQGPSLDTPAHPELRKCHATEAVSISGGPVSIWTTVLEHLKSTLYFRELTYIIQVTLRSVADQTGDSEHDGLAQVPQSKAELRPEPKFPSSLALTPLTASHPKLTSLPSLSFLTSRE